jgi:hypothetical protein
LFNGNGGPYIDGDITELNDAWWDYLEQYVDEAAKRGLYVGITLGWWGHVLNHNISDLYTNGFKVAQRLNGKTNIVWLVAGESGSHDRRNRIPDDKMKAIVTGIRDGDEDDKLLTIHADYRRGTSISNDSELVDFNNWQTSQWCCPNDLPRKGDDQLTVWEAIVHDYEQSYNTPSGVKPTIDAEAQYENNKDFCGSTPFTIRRRAYFTILAGAFGHQYGAGGIWDALKKPEGCSGSFLDALEYDGAEDMGHLSKFLHSLGNDLLLLRPYQPMITEGQSDSYDEHIQAAIAKDGSYAIIYDSNGGKMKLDLQRMSSQPIKAKWFNPDTGEYSDNPSGFSNKNTDQEFTAPSSKNDWLLFLYTE